jgi:rhamnosyltransferase
MATPDVTVAVPVYDAGARLALVLDAVRAQRTARTVEMLVCDSGSRDGSVALAGARGARLLTIARHEFSHGATRNLLASEARGAHVVFLTQDAVPATVGWLDALLDAFASAPDVGLAFGPYLAHRGATPDDRARARDFLRLLRRRTHRPTG